MKIVRHCERPKKRRSTTLQPFKPSRSDECKEQVDILSIGVCCYFQQKNTDYDWRKTLTNTRTSSILKPRFELYKSARRLYNARKPNMNQWARRLVVGC